MKFTDTFCSMHEGGRGVEDGTMTAQEIEAWVVAIVTTVLVGIVVVLQRRW